MQCSNNLKQIGLAMHNFHDTYDGIVPLGIGANNDQWMRVSFFVLLYPFTEQNNLYTVFASNTWGGSVGTGTNGITGDVGGHSTSAPGWWDQAKIQFPDFPSMIASVGTYRCPSRRGADLSYHDESTVNDLPGPLGDYATPIINMHDTGTGANYWHNCYRPRTADDWQNNKQALRIAVWRNDDPKQFQPRDNFSVLTDGLSNTLVLGEKHIPQNRLGVSKNGAKSGGTPPNTAQTADATYIVGGRWGMPGCARNILSRAPTLATPGDVVYEADGKQAVNGDVGAGAGKIMIGGVNTSGHAMNGSFDFGSSHPGVCNFLLGDGSVRAVPITTPKIAILARLVHVSDGEAVSMP